MTQESDSTLDPWSPPAADGIDLNLCRNPGCLNFGASPAGTAKDRRDAERAGSYRRSGMGSGRSKTIGLLCRCGEALVMVNNAAVAEEFARLRAQTGPVAAPSCDTAVCGNRGLDVVAHPEHYHRFGTTSAGSARWRCRECGRTISAASRGAHRLRQPERSEQVLRLLVNKVPMRRLCAVAEIQPKVLYSRISRLAEQCRALSAHFETRFLATARLPRLHLSTDRQDHALNWGSALERRPMTLRAVATAEVSSGFIVAQHVNYDPLAQPRAIELLARAAGDPGKFPPFRRHARLWLPHEVQGNPDETKSDAELRIPGVGGIVHENFTLAAHLQWLKPWVACAEHVQFSLDLDPGLDRFCLATFADRVRDGTVDAYLVRIDKDLTVSERKQALAQAEADLAMLREAHPGLSDSELVRQVMMERWLATKASLTVRSRPWIPHPYPTMNEPSRAIAPLSWDGQRPDAQMVAGMSRATLRSIDRYFMQVRRKVNLLERPIKSAGSSFRAWYGYSAYSPRVVVEVLDIFRTVYNFHLCGEDRRTPAQRLGLIDRPLSLAELCELSPAGYSLLSGKK